MTAFVFFPFPALIIAVAGQAGDLSYRRGMAGAAGGVAMVGARPFFVHTRLRVGEIEICRQPGSSGMTVGATTTERAQVEIRIRMTTGTLDRQPGKLAACMAGFTGYAGMCAVQREVAAIMIKRNSFPIGRSMAGGAVRAKAALVGIILEVAGITVCWRALIKPILVAIPT